MAKIFLDNTNYPQVNRMTTGQRVNITLSGTIVGKSQDGVQFEADSLTIGKRQKMSTQQIIQQNQLDRIEAKMPTTSTRL